MNYILSGLLIGLGVYAVLDFVKNVLLERESHSVSSSIKSDFENVRIDFDSAYDRFEKHNT